MFNLIIKRNLTPNQLYLLYSINENTSAVGINIHQELRTLESELWIIDKKDKAVPNYELQPKAVTLLQQMESFFSVRKQKVNNQVLGEDYNSYIDRYLLLFPKIKLPSGKPARTDKRNVETAFKWFFENHNYSWETIFLATEKYVEEYEKKRYMYMQTSQYFIRKQQSDKSWGSEMANWCSTVENGSMDNDTYFHEKVV